MKSFEGTVILVTGANSGIGESAVALLVRGRCAGVRPRAPARRARGIEGKASEGALAPGRCRQAGPSTARITLDALIKILRTGTAALADDRSLGFELGLAMKPTSHGWLGYAMMSCATLREACELGEHYLSVRASPWRVHVFVEGATAVMQFGENLPSAPRAF